DDDSNVRSQAAGALGKAFAQVLDKTMAWKDLQRLTQDDDSNVRSQAAGALGKAFAQVLDKTMAWKDLLRLTQDDDSSVRRKAAEALGKAFAQVPDKTMAWKDLHRLTQDEDSNVRSQAAGTLGKAFAQVLDKTMAWKDLHRLTQDEDSNVRSQAAEALGRAFVQVPDKTMAWKDLHRLTQDEDSNVRSKAAEALGKAFAQVPDKTMAWQELHRLTQDEDSNVRSQAAGALGKAFVQVPDRSSAWQELHRLTQDEDSNVRWKAAEALGKAFAQVPDRSSAWQELHRLTQDEDSNVRWKAAEALGKAFAQVPNRSSAWQELHRLTQDERSFVRMRAAEALGTAFAHVPDRSSAWQDLHRLTQDERSYVRMYAYHSLGRAAIFKATEAEDNDTLKDELMAAVAYFEKSSQESEYNPARFCLLFYRTYYTITFQEAEEDEIQRYLTEAKEAVGGSKSRDELLKAVESLAQALQESQRLKGRSLEEIASELNTYRWYCDKAASHMEAAEKGAPGAVKLLRKGSPIIEENIQDTIAEIQKKARQICEITRGSGTVYEAPGNELQKAAKGFRSDDIYNMQRCSSRVARLLKKFCRLLPAEDKEFVCDIVEEIEVESDFPIKLIKIETALSYLVPIVEDKSPSLADVVILTVLPEEYGSIRDRLSEPGPPPDMGDVPNRYAWKFGKTFCKNLNADYKIAVGMIGRAGTTEGALAAGEAVRLWRPKYILFSGIAGGLPDPKEIDSRPRLGDVVVADIIYGYEYGKLEREFKPRANWTYRTDQALLTGAMAYASSGGWRELVKAEPPGECTPQVVRGEIASGDQVVDDPTNDFFAQALEMWPKINAVEMEGAGAAAAIEQAKSSGISASFMMIRGISDLPRAQGKNKGREERDAWKAYASDVAAAFVMGWIADGLPRTPSA
ncbi:sister chromatid cohesion protein PDS5, partial [Methanothrix sp.]|uniref:sister chromatid cohesion protein PDS5 n=1 Tax=Methanothrix sp. TaxID=90426 RepID=UPI001BD6D433